MMHHFWVCVIYYILTKLNIEARIRDKIYHGAFILFYIIIRVHSAFSLVASCVLLKYTRTDGVN